MTAVSGPPIATEEWAAHAGEQWPALPPAPGASGVVTLVVSTGPRREVAFHWRYEEGTAVSGGPGPGSAPAAPGSGSARDAGGDLVLTVSVADAGEILSAAVAPSVAFMRGRLKASGDGGLLLAFLASTEDPAFAGWLRRVEPAS